MNCSVSDSSFIEVFSLSPTFRHCVTCGTFPRIQLARPKQFPQILDHDVSSGNGAWIASAVLRLVHRNARPTARSTRHKRIVLAQLASSWPLGGSLMTICFIPHVPLLARPSPLPRVSR